MSLIIEQIWKATSLIADSRWLKTAVSLPSVSCIHLANCCGMAGDLATDCIHAHQQRKQLTNLSYVPGADRLGCPFHPIKVIYST